jgi:nitrate/nitrite transport system substrate-binding protein
MERRDFLKTSVGAAAGLVLAGNATAAAATTTRRSFAAAGKTRKVTLGFIALTDCAPLVMAKELGYFKERDLDVTLVKQASWPATRDNLLANQIDGAHCLFSMPFSVATKVGGNGSTALKIAMILSNNGQAITLDKSLKGAGYGNLAAAKELLESKNPTLAMTFPGGTHDLWLRYWLKATKSKANTKIIPIPPPQMVANMKVGAMDGYCVGEPWNAVAVDQGIGFTHIASQDIWTHHPEKALVVTDKFASTQPDVLKDVMGATLKASKWLDVPANRAKAAVTLSTPTYVNALAGSIRGRLTGSYDLGAGLGKKTFTDTEMKFFRNGATSFPRRAHAIWALAQYKRLGLITGSADYNKLVSSILLQDLYAQVASAEKVAIPNDDMASFTVKLDGAVFDPRNPTAETKRP